MSRYRKITTICCAAVFALGLAACGGGGNDGLNTSQEQELQDEKKAAEEQVATLQGQINALRERLGIEDGDDPGHDVAALQTEIDRLQGLLDDADEEAEVAARKAMAATAAKLYAGISAPSGDVNSLAANDRAAAYNDAGTPTGAAIDTRILVSNSGDTALTAAIVLSEDKKTTVATNHGWAGKRYADPAGGDMVEAFVYSNVEAPKEGRKFGSSEPGSGDNRQFEYTLANGVLTAAEADGVGAGDDAFVAARVAFTNVTRTAGTETFRLPSPNPNLQSVISVPGSYHGVSGTYLCNTGNDRSGTCTAAVASRGFTLGGTGSTWTFKPSNSNARVMSGADSAYASYGWWLHKTENGKTFTASAFHDVKGDVTALVGATLNALQGTATYMGGAAGKYALASSTGGTNDAGHFTARATFEADFGDATDAGTITGTIDNFMGADGMARDWSVELKEADIDGTTTIGALGRTENNDTVWTIGETAASASGEWSGSLRNQGTDGVPKVATGTFYTEYGTAGKMVGAFGVNKQ